ncbi:uncharacterized protein LOC119168652 isoform X2 [Rhipicephalus microplus]|uniref:uncharacterized protein LOC119168652 isoform X2 n=1 Tax=Rhipicephalus microplus TaxID=6941 RepID=UPI003F6A67F7
MTSAQTNLPVGPGVTSSRRRPPGLAAKEVFQPPGELPFQPAVPGLRSRALLLGDPRPMPGDARTRTPPAAPAPPVPSPISLLPDLGPSTR